MLTLEQIISIVSTKTGFSVNEIKSPSRKAKLVQARQISMDLCRWNTRSTLLQIAIAHGRDNHATVIHACTCIGYDKRKNANLQKIYSEIETIIKSK
jgi:chromosomal replication initiator protein